MKFVIGMTHCERPQITLKDSINWVRGGGFDEPIIVQEDVEPKIGMVANAYRLFEKILQEDFDYALLLENDVMFCRSAKARLTEFLDNHGASFGYASLYTPIVYKNRFDIDVSGWHPLNLGIENVAGQAICLSKSLLEKIILDSRWEFYKENSLKKGGAGGGGDTIFDTFCTDRGLLIYYHIPSLTEHMGIISARPNVRDRPWHRGLNFNENF